MAAAAAPADVLFVTQFYRPEKIGSAPFCGDLAEAFAEAGLRVQVVTARPHYPETRVFEGYGNGERDHERIRGVHIARLGTHISQTGSAKERLMEEGSYAMSAGLALARNKSWRAPVTISLCPSALSVVVGAMACRRGGRHIALVHDIQSGLAGGLGMTGGAIARALRVLERFAFNRCDLIIVLSAEMRDMLREAGVTRPIHVQPIWIDPDAISPRPAASGPARVALYSGNFGRKQGLMQLVDLAEELAVRGSDLRILLRGRGSQDRLIAEAVTARGLTNVEFGELLAPELLADGLAEGDIHLVPQDPAAADYAVPSKIYGIMAAGRPFVATAREGSTLWRLQKETSAFVCVPPHDRDTYAREVMALARDAGRRLDMGRRGRAWVTAHCAKKTSLDALIGAIAAPG